MAELKLTFFFNVAQPFRRYVTIGRVALVNLAEDPLYGKLVAIVDVVDQNRVCILRAATRRLCQEPAAVDANTLMDSQGSVRYS